MVFLQTAKRYASLAVVALACACAQVSVTQLKPNLAPKPEGCALELFASEAEVKRPFETVCLLDGTASGSRSSDAVEAAKPKACACGADAIVVVSLGSSVYGATNATGGISTTTHGKAIMKGIRYLAQPATPDATAPPAPAGQGSGPVPSAPQVPSGANP